MGVGVGVRWRRWSGRRCGGGEGTSRISSRVTSVPPSLSAAVFARSWFTISPMRPRCCRSVSRPSSCSMRISSITSVLLSTSSLQPQHVSSWFTVSNSRSAVARIWRSAGQRQQAVHSSQHPQRK